jgi:hypothetical protein
MYEFYDYIYPEKKSCGLVRRGARLSITVSEIQLLKRVSHDSVFNRSSAWR